MMDLLMTLLLADSGLPTINKRNYYQFQATLQSAVSCYSPPLLPTYPENLKVQHDKSTSIHYIFNLNNANKLKWSTEQGDSSGNASDLYSWGVWFQYRLGHWLSWLRSAVSFPNPPRQIWTQQFHISHDRCLPHPSQFIIHYHWIILNYVVWVSNSVIKWTTNK
jgi:hypothetical protein